MPSPQASARRTPPRPRTSEAIGWSVTLNPVPKMIVSISRSTPSPSIVRHDVGTGGEDPSENMGPKYDTPTLLGVYKTAPYLHHGKAATLRDVVTTRNNADRHGKTSHLSGGEVDDLVEFLKALPYEDPEVAAKELGMNKVER